MVTLVCGRGFECCHPADSGVDLDGDDSMQIFFDYDGGIQNRREKAFAGFTRVETRQQNQAGSESSYPKKYLTEVVEYLAPNALSFSDLVKHDYQKGLVRGTYALYHEESNATSHTVALISAGKGVLIRLTGSEAQRYIEHQIKDNDAAAFEINDVSDEDVAAHFEQEFNNGRKLTSEESEQYNDNEKNYGTSKEARVTGEYKILDNNCVTTTIEGIKSAGSNEIFDSNSRPLDPNYQENPVNTTLELYLYLQSQVDSGSDNVERLENN